MGKQEQPTCYFCKKPATKDDECYGCQKHFHIECERWPLPNGMHEPEAHKPKVTEKALKIGLQDSKAKSYQWPLARRKREKVRSILGS
jgi:hypothetical protein